MSETSEPLAPSGADAPVDAAPAAAPATIEETLGRAFDEANAPPAEDAPARERDESGRFVGEAKPETPAVEAAPAAPEPAPAAPAVPDYIAPYAADFAMRGLPVERAVPYLLDTWKSIDADPQRGIQWLAGRYGLKVSFGDEAKAAPAPAPATDEWIDPAIAKLQEKISALEAETAQSKAAQQAAQEAAYYQALSVVQGEVQKFEQSKKGDGVDFNVLRPLMSAFIGQDNTLTLEQAYDMAVNAHPQTRATREAALRKEAEAEAAKKLEAARRASATNVRGDVGTGTRPRTIAESLARAYDTAQSGA